jgi:DNA modification methylase
MERKPGGYRKPTEEQRHLSMIPKDKFDRCFQQFWNLTGASTKEHPAPFPLELASRLVQMFSFVGDTVLDPFCGTGTTMVAALKTRRNSLGLELDTEYCRMAASRLMNENTSLLSHAELQIQLHTPAIVTPQDVPANALHDSGPDYRTKPAKKPIRPARKAKPSGA